jgi:hypothetical protein
MRLLSRRLFVKRPFRSRKTPVKLSESVHQHLNMYAIAAGAAGVSVLALAPPTQAKIVYTPAHRVIMGKHEISLDLNHDGIADFTISNHSFCTTDVCGRSLFARPAGNNKVVGVKGIGGPFSALKRGSRIGPRQPFSGLLMAASGTEYATVGPWLNVEGRYLGLKFFVKGHLHYGWARFNVTAVGMKITATLTGYAYETVPNKPIIAGRTKESDAGSVEQLDASALPAPSSEAATLGLLALGSPGHSVWRRDRSTSTTR